MTSQPAPPERATDDAGAAALLASRLERYVHLDQANHPYLSWQLDAFRPFLGQRILEIGCGVGGILELLGPRELLYGVDVEPDVLAYAAQRFRERPECRFAVGDVGQPTPELLAELRGQRFDSVICINVLEHVRDDLAALQTLESLLVPGGSLALLVPAHTWLYGAYDRLDGHYRRYSRAHLRILLSHTGLRPLRLRYFNLLGALGWWVQYRLLRRSVHGQGHFGAMNRILPVVRALESRVPPPFGLSLVAICRREGTAGTPDAA